MGEGPPGPEQVTAADPAMGASVPDFAVELPANRVLSDEDVAAIAEATATRLAEIVTIGSTTFALVDARRLAQDLGVSLDFVYAHATELGAMRLGSGPKARIRFDLDRARLALEGRGRRRDGRGRTPVRSRS